VLTPADALAAAARPSPKNLPSTRRVLVCGGAGELGSQVVEALLGAGRFAAVGVWTVLPLQPALRGLVPLAEGDWAGFGADAALIVFDRERKANGRDEAFGRPEPVDLVPLAARLRALGARTLVVVVPHAPGRLPMALRAGLASLDESAVAALGFEHLVFMRPAQSAADARADSAPARVAQWLLGNLHWMVPQREQPVRAATVARVAARLAAELPASAPGTRVLPAELLWAAAQQPTSHAVTDAWLAGQAVALPAARQRW
jgi:hypothetical protein